MKASFQVIGYRPGVLTLLDQTLLPLEERSVELSSLEEVARAIETMIVRGAPAIGVAAAFGMALAARTGEPLETAEARLASTRPTAVNLFWALKQMRAVWAAGEDSAEALESAARRIYEAEEQACLRMGELGAALIEDGAGILTHCNAGALATVGIGTALAPIRIAHGQGKRIKVYAGETRPRMQGGKLTTWELMKDGIDVTLVPDTAVAHLLGKGLIDCAFVGADRIAANGDVANKIGTRGVACALRCHERPLYVVAPWSTVDMSIDSGADIPIEERSPEEVTHIDGARVAPEGVRTVNPAFDVTPSDWIAGVITERGFTGRDIAHGLRNQQGGAARKG